MEIPPLPGPEEDAAIARSEFAAGHREHAAHHIACALGSDPLRRDWLFLLEMIADSHSDLDQLLPIDPERTYFATAAARAYLLARKGELSEAMDLLLQVVAAKPEVPYLEWAIQWLQAPQAQNTLDMAHIATLIAPLVDPFLALSRTEGLNHPAVVRVAPFLQLLSRTQPPDETFLFFAASLTRRMGLLDVAAEFAETAYRQGANYQSCVAMALIHRQREDTAQAIRFYEEALRYEPEDVSVRMDIADLLFENGDMDGADRWYSDALRLEPKNAWSQPSLLAARYYRDSDPQWKEQLFAYAAANPQNERAQDLASRLDAYFGTYLPEPQEATINAVRQMLANAESQGMPKGTLKLTLNWLEAPSAFLAIRQELGEEIGLEVAIVDAQTPDTRLPHVPVTYLLWRYDGMMALPAVPQGDPIVASQIANIAAQPYHFAAWRAWAQTLGAHLGPTQIPNILSAMVHPPPAPSHLWAWSWFQRVQVAACLTLAHVDTGWTNSARKKALFDLANGPMDWPVHAAMIALTSLAMDDPAIEADVTRLFNDLLNVVPTEGYVCWLYPLLSCYARLPHITQELRQKLQKRIQEIESD